MFDNIQNNNNYYFVSDNKKFNTDIEAIANSIKNGKPAYMVLNYKFMDYSWKTEPENNIEYYHDLHTKILASRYKNIILAYSGGTDSHTILKSLIRCKIKNVVLYVYGCDEHYNNKLREDIQKDFIKSLTSYASIFKQLNYTIVGLEKHEAHIFPDSKDLEKLISKTPPNTYGGLSHSYSWYYMFNSKDTSKLLHLKNNTCLITGYEKPNLIIEDGWWKWQLFSSVFTDIVLPTYDNYDLIHFFITDDVPELHIKLAWLKAEILEKLMNKQLLPKTASVAKELQYSDNKYYTTINEYMGYKGLNYVLNTNLYKSGLYRQIVSSVSEKNRELLGLISLSNEYIANLVNTHGLNTDDLVLRTKAIPIRPVKN